MTKKKYPLGGWVAPIWNLKDPDYCESGCPVCRAARKGSRLARMIQSLELKITGGGCPWGRARQEQYNVAPDQEIAPDPVSDDEDAPSS